MESLFKEAPNNKKARELKEEIIVNLIDKYEDLIEDGKTEKEAYQIVISGIGDIDELLQSLNVTESSRISLSYELKRRKRNALYVTASVALYILSIILIAMTEELGLPEFVSVSAFLSLAGIATCLLIYNAMSMPKYEKISKSMVEDFKEWKQSKNKNNEIRKGIDSIIWTLITIIYLLVSLIFGIWYISWIIFLIGGLIQQIVHLMLKVKEQSNE